ncbi:MAG: hypothetical protein C0391_07275 [Anaerolinea sp.]|nr:hypothetical protein [Anaerolinea sp.]
MEKADEFRSDHSDCFHGCASVCKFVGDYLPQQNLEIRVKLPKDFDPEDKKLTLIQVETGEMVPADFQVDDGWMSFVLPGIDIWSVALLK